MQIYVVTLLVESYKGAGVWILGAYPSLKNAKDALELHLYERFEDCWDTTQELKEYVDSHWVDETTWDDGDCDDNLRFEIHKTDLYES